VKSATKAPATRSSLLRFRRRLDQVHRGAALLRRKRQSLVEELFARARTAVTSREAIDAQARRAWRSVWLALGSEGCDAVTALGWPTREIEIELAAIELWGLRVVELVNRPTVIRGLAARGVLPGPGETASQNAARDFEVLVEQLLDAAPQEHVMRRLGQALARTTRLVNTLEQRIAVRLTEDLAAISSTLNEREREEHLRIKRLIARRQPGTGSR
jgi:V/A-type H+/Na+-transporting ATPase subunit D